MVADAAGAMRAVLDGGVILVGSLDIMGMVAVLDGAEIGADATRAGSGGGAAAMSQTAHLNQPQTFRSH